MEIGERTGGVPVEIQTGHLPIRNQMRCRLNKFAWLLDVTYRSQWARGLRHELSSLARTLGSWVRIPLEAWMSVCVYSVFVLGSQLTNQNLAVT
jgi:hypothetical protein